MKAAAEMLELTPAEVEVDGFVLYAALPAAGRKIYAAGLPRIGVFDQRGGRYDGIFS